MSLMVLLLTFRLSKSPFSSYPLFSLSAGFYITNAMNVFRGNAASGGWTGFAFPNLRFPINNHQALDKQKCVSTV